MCSSKRFVNDNDFTHDCDDETFECGAAFLKILFDQTPNWRENVFLVFKVIV